MADGLVAGGHVGTDASVATSAPGDDCARAGDDCTRRAVQSRGRSMLGRPVRGAEGGPARNLLGGFMTTTAPRARRRAKSPTGEASTPQAMTTNPPGDVAQACGIATNASAAAHKAYLVWSPNFARNLLVSAAIEGLVLLLCATVPAVREVGDEAIAAVQFALLDGAHQLKWWSAIAMLASACCVVQLILSALAVGCSGLNGLLGPLRPPMLVAAALLQASSWYIVVAKKPDQAPSVAVSTTLAVLLSLSPEILDVIQNRRRRRRRAAAEGESVTLQLQKVSCAVCEAKVCSIAEGVERVARCAVDIDRGEATLTLSAGADSKAAVAEAVDALARGGYPLLMRPSGAAANAEHGSDDGAFSGKGLGPMLRTWSDGPVMGGMVGGLLGSSCCALQLGLNLLASVGMGLTAGCAGFNTYLGPLRPYMRMATATYLTIQWARSRAGKRRTLVAASLLAATLTYMPEGLLLLGAPALAPPTEGALSVNIAIGGMGCEACQHAVRGALTSSSGVLNAVVRGTEEAGVAELYMHPQWGFNLSELVAKVEEAGFEMDRQAAAAAIDQAVVSSVAAQRSTGSVA